MKAKRGEIGKIVTGIVFTIIVLPWIFIIGLILILKGIDLMWEIREYQYYSDEENFIEVTSEIDHIVWNYSEQRLSLSFSDIPEIFSDRTFKIEEENFQRVVDNGGEEYLKLGTTVTFVSAPKYFGDGYMMPIVAIKVDEKELLEYEEGYKGLIESYHIFKSYASVYQKAKRNYSNNCIE